MLDSRYSLAIEPAYVSMLAYAAQGRRDTAGGLSDEIRDHLRNILVMLDGLAERCLTAFVGAAAEAAAALDAFVDVLDVDLAKARAAVRMVLTQRTIRSEVIDNLNAAIRLRALPTNLFLVRGFAAAGAAA